MASSYSVAPVQSELKMTLYNKEVYSLFFGYHLVKIAFPD
jgi:hypothetical protein